MLGLYAACPRLAIAPALDAGPRNRRVVTPQVLAMRSFGVALFLMVLTVAAARSEPTPCRDDALGTARILPVDAAATPRIGRKHSTLALAPKEVVLTFDDGPEPGTTARVLDALQRECVRASFFLSGRSALVHRELARRQLREPPRKQSWRNCAVSRHQGANRSDASRLAARAQVPRLSYRARDTGSPLMQPIARDRRGLSCRPRHRGG